MARYRDDEDDRDDRRRGRDDDRDDDRSRRRRESDPPKKGGAGTVLLIVGLAVGIPLLVCGGVVAYVVYVASQVVSSVKQGIEQVAGTAQAELAATHFLGLIKTDPNLAYDSGTANFRSTMTREQFAKLVKDNPVLTAPNTPRTSGFPTPTGTAPNRTISLTYTITAGETLDPPTPGTGKTPGSGPLPTAPKPPPTTPSTAPLPKGTTCTIRLVEQADNTWKVDGFTVP